MKSNRPCKTNYSTLNISPSGSKTSNVLSDASYQDDIGSRDNRVKYVIKYIEDRVEKTAEFSSVRNGIRKFDGYWVKQKANFSDYFKFGFTYTDSVGTGLFYIEENKSIFYFLEECGFDTENLYYYVGKHMLTDDELHTPIEDLKTIMIFPEGTIIKAERTPNLYRKRESQIRNIADVPMLGDIKD